VLLAAVLGLLLALVAQLPVSYRFAVGQADGPGGDLPLVQGFNTPVQDSYGRFRWTAGRSLIILPGLGARAIDLEIHSHPISAAMAANGPRTWTLVADGGELVTVPVQPQGGALRVLIAPSSNPDHTLELRSTTSIPPGDTRALGVLVDGVVVRSPAQLHWPAWRAILAWITALALVWIAIRRLGFGSASALRLSGPLVALACIADLLDPPRFALGAEPALIATGLALALAIGLTATRRNLYVLACGLALASLGLQGAERWWSQCAMLAAAGLALAAVGRTRAEALWRAAADTPGAGTTRTLALITVGVFALRYGGKIYPEAMPGDIGFHINRFADTLRGTVLLLSKNRGVDFPYPSALYVLLAPLNLIAPDRAVLLQMSAALMDAASPAVVFVIARRSGLIRAEPFALLASGLYALGGAGFMPTWWNFSTHIFAQFAHLTLIGAIVVAWDRLDARSGRRMWPAIGALVVLQLLVYLGHFGFWINMSLLAAFGLTLLVLNWLRTGAGRPALLVLISSLMAAQLIAVLLFYSAYTDLLLGQIQRAAAGGLTGVAGRAPVPAEILWRTLRDGLYAHIGLLPIPLALCGAALALARPRPARTSRRVHLRKRSHVTLALMLITFGLGASFAVLPFVTGSTLSTRWLMFAMWALCVGAAASAEQLWRRGRAGRMLAALVIAYPLWISAAMWVAALAWRVRPPEPF
jgi:hypothetical protein